jgi:hypothetical protein
MHRVRLAGALGAATLAVTAVAPAVASDAPGPITIHTLSNRADLVTGGDAAVGIRLPPGVSLASPDVAVLLNGRDVKRMFSTTGRQAAEGVVTGLTVGANRVEVRLRDGRGARLTITNRDQGGPVFAGPQVQPWICATEENGLGAPQDKQCSAPTQVSYLYQPRDAEAGEYEPYDSQSPPDDVAETTTEQGSKVPFIIRVETGTMDRGIYTLGVLADPKRPWTRTAPQNGWTGKVYVPFGGGCGTPHRQKPPLDSEEQSVVKHTFLARGWMGIASGLFSNAQNCNDVVAAEALMMLKEHVEEQYGPIRHTIGMGGSGGSIMQYQISAAYPGLLDGITPNSAFPDNWQTAQDISDCDLLNAYFTTQSPHLWPSPDQMAAVQGKADVTLCAAWKVLFSDAADPANRGATGVVPDSAPVRQGCELPPDQMYHPQLNPKGVRCAIQDYQAAIWGRRGPLNAAPIPLDNIGVQYGLRQVEQGDITPGQFVDLNSKIGGWNNDAERVPERMFMDNATVTTMYRASRTTDPRQLAKVAILDIRNNSDGADIHQPYMSFVVRQRLQNANRTHANHVMWEHRDESEEVFRAAVLAVDRWLSAVEQDGGNRSRAEKLLRNKPRDLVDTCWIDGTPTTKQATCRAAYPHSSDARIQAGGPLSGDIKKCRLKPMNRADYDVTFSDAEWATLRGAFPTGVCDWSRPSVGGQPSIPWMSFAAGPGGQPLGTAPSSELFTARGATGTRPLGSGAPTDSLPATGNPLPTAALVLLSAALVAAAVRCRIGPLRS